MSEFSVPKKASPKSPLEQSQKCFEDTLKEMKRFKDIIKNLVVENERLKKENVKLLRQKASYDLEKHVKNDIARKKKNGDYVSERLNKRLEKLSKKAKKQK